MVNYEANNFTFTTKVRYIVANWKTARTDNTKKKENQRNKYKKKHDEKLPSARKISYFVKYTLFSFTQKTTQHYFGSSKYRKRCTQISFELVSTSRGNVPNLENFGRKASPESSGGDFENTYNEIDEN